MGSKSEIGWTDATFNPWWGCDKVSEECRHCYIGPIMKRGGREPFGGPIRTKNWSGPPKWDRTAKTQAKRLRVFTCSMSDFFHEGADQWRPDAWQLFRSCSSLDWLILTKRPERMLECLPADWHDGYPNVWLGVTCGVESSTHRISYLEAIHARIRFVSAEPLLGPVNLRPYLHFVDWVITGCEQAAKSKRREMELHWVREIDQQCRDANTAHFYKQYYLDNSGVPVTDGMLDGEQRQAWPIG